MTQSIEQLKALLEKATKSEWRLSESGATIRASRPYTPEFGRPGFVDTRICFGYDGSSDQRRIDYALIVAMKSALPDLLAERDTLLSQIESDKARMGKMEEADCHGLDTPERVCFYEQDFYVLSNFSAFRLQWNGMTFDTLEAAYHWAKFPDDFGLQTRIRTAPSAHEAFKIAGEFKDRRRSDWDAIKTSIMRNLLRLKVEQHEYVRRKLLATGDRELVENSWRDDFWGWGPNRDGQNMLGKLWMEVRAELRAALTGVAP